MLLSLLPTADERLFISTLYGAGFVHQALGAFVLLSINLVCISIAGVTTFLAQGIRPLNWWEQDKAKKATTIAVSIWVLLLAALVVLLYLINEPRL